MKVRLNSTSLGSAEKSAAWIYNLPLIREHGAQVCAHCMVDGASASRSYVKSALHTIGPWSHKACRTTSLCAPHLGRGDQTGRMVAPSIFLTSKFRPQARTLQAMRASLLASAIASTLRCSRFLAASIQGLSPWRSQLLGDTDHGDHTVKLLCHGVLLSFGASCQLTCWQKEGARPDHPISGLHHAAAH